ncbi:hypothetical protein HZC34_03630 [Candidatus Saganbacteria bacterium]|nr:hypothetical protein [Candidatus Saganbacteria bacterium]
MKVVGRGGEKEFFFRRARGMDLDEKGDLYISDEEDGKPCLMVLDSNYNYLKKISFDDGEIKPNSWILVRQGNIYVASMQFGALIENPPYPYSAANIELYSLAEKKSAMFCLKVIVYPIPPHSNAFTKENIANAIDFSTDKAGNIIIMSPWKILILNKGLTCIQEIYGDDISKENDFLIYDIPGTGYTNQNLLGRFQSVAIDRDDCILVCGGRLLFVLDAKGALAVAKPVRETLAEIHRAPSFFGWFFRDNDYMAMSEILGGGIALLSGVFGGLSFIGAIVCGLSFGAICAFILRVKNWFKPKGKDFENMQKRKQVKSLPIIPGTEIVKRK